jgi:hypothetical protein
LTSTVFTRNNQIPFDCKETFENALHGW